MHFIRIVAVIAASTICHPVSAQDDVPLSQAQISLSFAPVVQDTAPAVVNIYAARVVEQSTSPFADDPFFSQFFGGLTRSAPRVQNSLGSGVIVGSDGIVVSNHHVVENATDIRVVLPDRREFDGTLLISDAASDIAIIRLIDAQNLPALPLGDSDALAVGDLVLAIGNPFGVGQTVTSGIVSGLARSGGPLGARAGYYIQTDAPINPGNSGGALVDMRGALIGVNTALLTRSGGSNGIGFAIPSDLVARYIEQAKAGHTTFQRPWPGIATQDVDAELAEALGQDVPMGIMITRIHDQSSFGAAGLRQGDVLVALDGVPVNAAAEFEYRLAILGPGASVTVGYQREGTAHEAWVVLALPPDTQPAAPVRIEGSSPLAGLVVADMTPALIDQLDLPLDADGVVVVTVSGYAKRLGLRPGDRIVHLNGDPITGAADLRDRARGDNRQWDLEVQRGRQILRIRVRG